MRDNQPRSLKADSQLRNITLTLRGLCVLALASSIYLPLLEVTWAIALVLGALATVFLATRFPPIAGAGHTSFYPALTGRLYMPWVIVWLLSFLTPIAFFLWALSLLLSPMNELNLDPTLAPLSGVPSKSFEALIAALLSVGFVSFLAHFVILWIIDDRAWKADRAGRVTDFEELNGAP